MHTDFETLLKQTVGLDGSSAIARAVHERQGVLKLKDAHSYWELVTASGDELQELVETVVVPETWFFRDREAFAALGRFALDEWLPKHPNGRLRLLSLPCSTGEEAYSMAIALLDAGLPPERFIIEALDVSTRALARARHAVYGKNSFRGRDFHFRDRYFTATKQGQHLEESVRQKVRFQKGNIFDPDLLPGTGHYDIIFCRNLLIYFDHPTQDRAVGVLARLLDSHGLLFVGPSETGLLLNHGFVSTKVPLAFSFRKGEVVPREVKTVVLPAVQHHFPHPHHHPRVRHTPAPPAPIASPPPARVDLDEAVYFADQGRLAEAARRCEEFLAAHGPSARALYLLGLVRDATGQHAEAESFYRKALYLEPNHPEALLHLALLLEKQGDESGAKLLNDRLRRLEQKRKK